MQLDPARGKSSDCPTMSYAVQPDAAIWIMSLRQAALRDIVHWPYAQDSSSSSAAHSTPQASINPRVAGSGICTAQMTSAHLLPANATPVPAFQQGSMLDLT